MLHDSEKTKEQLLCELHHTRQKLIELEDRFLTLQENNIHNKEVLDTLQEVIFETNLTGKVLFYNKRCYEFFGYDIHTDVESISIFDSIVPEDRSRMIRNMKSVMTGKKLGVVEYIAQKTNGYKFPILVHSIPIVKNEKILGIRGIIMDISERKNLYKKLTYLSIHDTLTGVYNRTFFTQKMKEFNNKKFYPVGIIICDLDGLKLVNDIFGHAKGDYLLKTASRFIKASLTKRGIVARTGGDEFAILIPKCTKRIMDNMIVRLRKIFTENNTLQDILPFNMSMGYAIANDNMPNTNEIYKIADNNMYREKLHRSHSIRKNLFKTTMQALERKNIITDQYAKRLKLLVQTTAYELGLSKDHMRNLLFFASFHDIGKVSISDSVLLKPGYLTPTERAEMQRHSEIGHRIAISIPDLTSIADFILKHHEWWNGEGYPIGLKGEEIPVECRIIAIIDAYDAMCNDRPYRKALPKEKALKELQNCAGKQFDPFLTDIFVKMMSQR